MQKPHSGTLGSFRAPVKRISACRQTSLTRPARPARPDRGEPMELGCLFAPTAQTAEHIALAEALGYERALVYDSPTFLADPWITLALAAARTSVIRLGVAAITPRLRHVVAAAGALATLHAHAPGRGIPLYIAAHGPRGYGVAERAGDGIVTNVSHRGGNPLPTDMGQVQVLYYGTVLAPGEGYDDPRVLSAAGPYAAFQLHLGELGVAGDTAECAAFGKALAEVAENRRHLDLHRAHLIDLTELDRPFVTGELIARTTGSGTQGQVRAGLSDIAAWGARGVLYGPMGDDIPGELRAFAEAAAPLRSA